MQPKKGPAKVPLNLGTPRVGRLVGGREKGGFSWSLCLLGADTVGVSLAFDAVILEEGVKMSESFHLKATNNPNS